MRFPNKRRQIMSMSSQRLLPGALGTSVIVFLLGSVLFLGGCGPQPSYQIVESPPPARVGTVESVREVAEPKNPTGAGHDGFPNMTLGVGAPHPPPRSDPHALQARGPSSALRRRPHAIPTRCARGRLATLRARAANGSRCGP